MFLVIVGCHLNEWYKFSTLINQRMSSVSLEETMFHAYPRGRLLPPATIVRVTRKLGLLRYLQVIHFIWLIFLHIESLPFIYLIVSILLSLLWPGRLLIMVVRKSLLRIEIQKKFRTIDIIPFDEAHYLNVKSIPRFEVLEYLQVNRFKIVVFDQVIFKSHV